MTIKTNHGGSSSAAIYSVVQTALENDLKIYEYLVYLFQQMPSENFILQPDRIDKSLTWSKELLVQCYKSKKMIFSKSAAKWAYFYVLRKLS